jgi:bifunctional non-homologous end joining protein LigD
VHTALRHLGDRNPWRDELGAPQLLSPGLVVEGLAIPAGRVQAMHEGRRRARSRRAAAPED